MAFSFNASRIEVTFLADFVCKKGELTVICQLVTNVTMWANGRQIEGTDEFHPMRWDGTSEMSHLFISHNCHIRQWKICVSLTKTKGLRFPSGKLSCEMTIDGGGLLRRAHTFLELQQNF